jgi:hypothetical protein
MLRPEDLVERIASETRPPVFILGSGVTMPLVPGTAEIETLIAEEYGRRTGRRSSKHDRSTVAA